ncbi:MAG: PadR family transcriptional regulator [Solirubrobacteraceae bacterium]
MSSTRLLVLGTVRIFQPVHGYFVRRELLSWQAEQWAHLNPGSIYNALRTLAKDGFLQDVGTEAHGGRPARTSYRLTPDGETEFLVLERDALWNVDPFAPDQLLAAWSFAWALTRAEVTAAFEHRLQQIDAMGRAAQYAIADLQRSPDKPSHVAEHVRLNQSRLDGEGQWTRDALKRIRAGEHWFAGEPESPWRDPNPPPSTAPSAHSSAQ